MGAYKELARRYVEVMRTLNRSVRVSDKYQIKLKKLNQELDQMMRHDYLTELMNRRAFYDRAKTELSRSQRHGRSVCILMGDVDKFKCINDRYGHDVGDLVLKETAQAFKVCLRDEDLKVRWGGEEFLAFLPETNTEGALAAAEKLRKYIEDKEISAAGNTIRVTISIGVAQKGERDLEEAIKGADSALYEAKTTGRNKVVLGAE
jgi:diguanylate cyclase (GGDEF)-like protein